ncbi:MAG TPA: hypothetical protein VHM88_21560 [Candidatus Acidoferrales bacterium]|nr:hypothetical protein [Candidatus Acidoferrales bacterium]
MTPTLTPTQAERRFTDLLEETDRAATAISKAHGTSGPPLDLASYPARTVIGIERQATVEFRGSLVLLRDPILAYNGEILMRSLLEAAGQVWRIYGTARSSEASRRRRAICFEFGSITAIYRASRPRRNKTGKLLPSTRRYSTKEGRASIRERYADIKSLHDQTCPSGCAGTSGSQISESLSNMSKRHTSLRWVSSLWEVTSMVAHQTLQRGLAGGDPSALAMVPMDVPGRCALLDRLLSSYGVSIEIAGRIHCPQLKPFQVAARGIKKELTEIGGFAQSSAGQ